MSVLQKNLDAMNSLSSRLLPSATDAVADAMRDQVRLINDQWAAIVQLANTQHKDLSMAENTTQALEERLRGASVWMDGIRREHLGREYTVHSREELTGLHKEFTVSTL